MLGIVGPQRFPQTPWLMTPFGETEGPQQLEIAPLLLYPTTPGSVKGEIVGVQQLLEVGIRFPGRAMVGEKQSVMFPPSTDGPHRLPQTPGEYVPGTKTLGPHGLVHPPVVTTPFGAIKGLQQLLGPPVFGPQKPVVLYPGLTTAPPTPRGTEGAQQFEDGCPGMLGPHNPVPTFGATIFPVA